MAFQSCIAPSLTIASMSTSLPATQPPSAAEPCRYTPTRSALNCSVSVAVTPAVTPGHEFQLAVAIRLFKHNAIEPSGLQARGYCVCLCSWVYARGSLLMRPLAVSHVALRGVEPSGTFTGGFTRAVPLRFSSGPENQRLRSTHDS